MATQVIKNGSVVFTGSGTFALDGIGTINLNCGLGDITAIGAGQVQPSFTATMESKPMVTFDVTDLATLIGAGIKESPFAVPQTTVITGVQIYGTKAVDLGTIGGASSHLRINIAKALVVLKRISCRSGEVAKASVEIHALYDGSNAPITYSTGQSLPHTPLIDEQFTLGPSSINGSAIDSVVGMDLDMGVSVQKVVTSGDLYPSLATVTTIAPRMTLACKDATVVNTFALLGTAQSSTASLFYFRKMAKGGTRVADGTAEHIKIAGSASQGMIWAESATLSADTGDANLVVVFTAGSSTLAPALTVAAIT